MLAGDTGVVVERVAASLASGAEAFRRGEALEPTPATELRI